VTPGTEIHFHALHGVDDGPETMADSLELLRLALADGTDTVVATPHVRGDHVTDVALVTEGVRELRAAAEAEGIAVRLLPGAELGHDMVGRLGQAELDAVAQGPPAGRWLLVETPFEGMEDDFHAATDELRDRGFAVAIAHPERSADADLYASAGLRRELAAGARAQVNAQSVTGDHGPAAQDAAMCLIREGLIDAISSDAHGPARPPLLGDARARLVEAGIAPRVAARLTRGNPRGLLARGIPSRDFALVA
jgi:protein-tyrosine phosphatase